MTGKVHLTEEKETLFLTLYAKAIDNRSPNSILKDQDSENILNAVDYDFSKVKRFGDNILVVRALHYDTWVRDFLKKNPAAVVIYLGCGLDTRIKRISPDSKVSWYDIDYPEVIQLRKNFFSDSDGYKMIGSPLTEPGWFEQIPAGRPTLILAEGVLEYLAADDIKILFDRLISRFGNGQILFDVMSSFAVKSAKRNLKENTGAVHKWAVDDPDEINKFDARLKHIEEIPLLKTPHLKKLRLKKRMVWSLMSFIPKFRNMIRLMKYEF